MWIVRSIFSASFLKGAMLFAATAHLTLVACGAAGLVLVPFDRPLGQALRWYGAVSGADSGYGFFAPSVGSQLRARFELSDDAGGVWQDDLETGHNQEIRLRIGSVVNLFPGGNEEEAFRHDLAASWAAQMLGRHPEAKQVTVEVEVYIVPPMADYRAGHEPRWVPLYGATFVRSQVTGEK